MGSSSVPDDDHPSRSLVERLILDEGSWAVLYNEWHKLVDGKAKWEFLVNTLATEGARAMREQLHACYQLTPGAADAVVELLQPYGLHLQPSTSFSLDAVTSDRCLCSAERSLVDGENACM